jgi:hypothetical protein
MDLQSGPPRRRARSREVGPPWSIVGGSWQVRVNWMDGCRRCGSLQQRPGAGIHRCEGFPGRRFALPRESQKSACALAVQTQWGVSLACAAGQRRQNLRERSPSIGCPCASLFSLALSPGHQTVERAEASFKVGLFASVRRPC